MLIGSEMLFDDVHCNRQCNVMAHDLGNVQWRLESRSSVLMLKLNR